MLEHTLLATLGLGALLLFSIKTKTVFLKYLYKTSSFVLILLGIRLAFEIKINLLK